MAGWEKLSELVRREIIQRGEEGCAVNGFESRLALCGEDEERLMALYRDLSALEPGPDFAFVEPSDLAGIRALRPDASRASGDSVPALNEAAWRDKFLGAWSGRLSGCALGKPLE